MKFTKADKKAFEKGIERGGFLRIANIMKFNRGILSGILNGKRNATIPIVKKMKSAKDIYLKEMETIRAKEIAAISKLISK